MSRSHLPLIGGVGAERKGMYATGKLFSKASVDAAMSPYQRFAAKLFADQYNAEM